MSNGIKELISDLKKYRLNSKNYVQMSYFVLISILILKYSQYIVVNHIEPIKLIAIILPLMVLIIIPIGFIYYSIKTGIEIYKANKNKLDTNHVNKYIWVNDIIYIGALIYAEFFSKI